MPANNLEDFGEDMDTGEVSFYEENDVDMDLIDEHVNVEMDQRVPVTGEKIYPDEELFFLFRSPLQKGEWMSQTQVDLENLDDVDVHDGEGNVDEH